MIRTIGPTRTEGGNIFNAYLLTYLCLSPFTGYLTALAAAILMFFVKTSPAPESVQG